MPDETAIKLINAGLDEDSGEIILRGVLVPESLQHLKIDDYQREILPIAKLLELTEAFQHGSVPDIDLGMRGGNYTERDGVYTLKDEVFIVDGLQRRTAALEAMKSRVRPRLGATVHFNTNKDWERRRFRILNVAQTKLSPNVLLRNMYLEGSPALDILHGLTLDSSFPVHHKICWDQRSHKEHLITALIFLRSAASLHSSFQTGLRDTAHGKLVGLMDKFVIKTGHSLVRQNIMLFWKVLDQCWPLSQVEVKQFFVPIKGVFLTALSLMLTQHDDFWADHRLIVSADLRSKLASFPVHDPHIISLAGVGGHSGARKMMYQILIEHINSGKRTRRLTPKKFIAEPTFSVREVPQPEAPRPQ